MVGSVVLSVVAQVNGSYLVVPCHHRLDEMAALRAAILLGEEGRAGGGF